MKIVVGVGNPGRQYAGTRHNVGYRVIENLARKLDAGVPRERFDSATQDTAVDGEKVLLLRPLTYVNLSGGAVRRAADWFKCEPGDIMVVCDDLNLPVAQLRARKSGSGGGHNGLQSIIDHLGTTAFPRLRIGIGSPPPLVDGAAYVLGRFSAEEEPLIAEACAAAAEAVIAWVRRGIDACMNEFNRRPDAGDDGAESREQ